ncbi:MAG: hypothetical protein QOJ63_2154 [Solirubrobacteraceae bacterium]|jgi:hypothetical protein|nr:hypothetical protein [Solirubrobacteraceae bacterium]
MLIDEPSSSSPADGDARLTEVAPQSSPRAIGTSVPAPPSRGRGGPSPRAERGAAGDRARHDPRLIETAGAPAPEALRATTIAAAVVRELYESGRELRFAFAPSGERVTVLLCDMDGAVLSRLTPARALEIATGEPVPGGRRG